MITQNASAMSQALILEKSRALARRNFFSIEGKKKQYLAAFPHLRILDTLGNLFSRSTSKSLNFPTSFTSFYFFFQLIASGR
jgi:hypothetical protein